MHNKLVLSAAIAVAFLTGTRASAQTVTDQNINATAEIDQLLELTIVGDGIVECGTVSAAAPTVCGPEASSATVHVLANVTWELQMEDLGGAGSNSVLLNAPTGRFGNFVMELEFSDPDVDGTGPGAGTSTGGADVEISNTGIRAIGDDVEVLNTFDDFGAYSGELIVTLLASP